MVGCVVVTVTVLVPGIPLIVVVTSVAAGIGKSLEQNDMTLG